MVRGKCFQCRLAALVLAASLSSGAVWFAGGMPLLAAAEDDTAAKPAPIPPSRIHEELVAQASRGSNVIALRVASTETMRHVAWVEDSKGSKTVWLDGKQIGGAYDEVRYPAFRGRSSLLSFVASRESKWMLSVGGHEYGGHYTKITAPDVGAEGDVLAGVCRGKQCRLLTNGLETGPIFEDIGAPGFSPRGDHYVYFGKRGKKWVTLIDGKETGPEVDDWWAYRWWPEGSRIAVAARVGAKFTWVVDGRPGPLFDVISGIALRADGQHYAYGGVNAALALKEPRVVGSMVVDGTQLEATYVGSGMLDGWTLLGSGQLVAKGLRSLSPEFHGVSDPHYAAEGELLFGRRLGDGQVVVAAGEREGPRFDDLVSAIVVSADGEHMAYVAKKGDSFVEVNNLEPGPSFSARRDVALVSWIGMTKSRRLTYEIVRGGAEFKAGRSQRALRRVVVDGVAGPEYNALGITPCRFSDFDQQYAYVVLGAEGNRDRLVLNGRERELYDEIVSGTVTFLPGGGVEFIARQERRLLRVTIEPQ